MTKDANKKVADAIAKVLADSHVIYMKAHNFHWNVEGPQFLPFIRCSKSNTPISRSASKPAWMMRAFLK